MYVLVIVILNWTIQTDVVGADNLVFETRDACHKAGSEILGSTNELAGKHRTKIALTYSCVKLS